MAGTTPDQISMDAKTLSQIARAANALSASRLAFPKGMRDRIYADIEKNYATYVAKEIDKNIKKLEAKLGKGKKRAPTLRIGPTLSGELSHYGESTHDRIEEDYHKGKLDPDQTEALDSFFRTHSSKDLKRVIELGPNPHKKSRGDRDPIDYVIYAIDWAVEMTPEPSAQKSGARLLDKLKKLAKPSSSGSGLSEGDEAKALKRLEEWQELKKELAPFLKKAGRKLVKKWTVPVDLSDLPKRYNLPAKPNESHRRLAAEPWEKGVLGPELHMWMRADKRIRRFGGQYSFNGHIISVVVPTAVPEDMTQLKRTMAKAKDTIEHELNHMVQWIGKAIYGPKYGTAYGPSETLPGEKGRGRSPKEAFPRATKNERYYLDPVEFYPNLETAVFYFLEKWKGGHSMDDFKKWVGMPGITNTTAPLFSALKKHDKKRYKKAVAEALQRVRKEMRKDSSFGLNQAEERLKYSRGLPANPKGIDYLARRMVEVAIENGYDTAEEQDGNPRYWAEATLDTALNDYASYLERHDYEAAGIDVDEERYPLSDLQWKQMEKAAYAMLAKHPFPRS